jgi:hypothetical protein
MERKLFESPQVKEAIHVPEEGRLVLGQDRVAAPEPIGNSC